MTGVVVDTSVWIEYFSENKKVVPEVEILHELLLNNQRIILCPIVYQEILQGIREENVYAELKEILESFPMLSFDILEVTKNAIDLYRGLRKKGVTIRKPYDCVIASYANMANAPVLHNDSDFENMEKNRKIKVYRG